LTLNCKINISPYQQISTGQGSPDMGVADPFRFTDSEFMIGHGQPAAGGNDIRRPIFYWTFRRRNAWTSRLARNLLLSPLFEQ